MKKLTCLFALVLGVLLTAPLAVVADDYVTEESRQFTVGAGSSLCLENISGDIEIVGWDRNVISVEAVKVSRGANAQRKAELVEVVMEQSGDSVEVEVEYPDSDERRRHGLGDSFNVSVDFTVRVPRDCSLEVDLVSGDMEVAGINSDVSIDLVSGNLDMRDIAGDSIDINSVSGNVEIAGISGDIDIEGVSGNIELNNVSGLLSVETTSGNVDVSAVELEGADIEILSGNIDLTISRPISHGEFDFEVFSGGITITLHADSAFEIDAEAGHSGQIRTNFDVELHGREHRRHLEGVVNGGGAEIYAEVGSGQIRIRQR